MRRAHASAPVRIDLAGGWTDVPPYSARAGGRVIAVALHLGVHVNVLPSAGGTQLISEDLDQLVEIHADGSVAGKGSLPLLEAFVARYPPGPATIITRSDVPKGSGLGTSGALGVAVLAALLHSRGEAASPDDLAQRAWQVETHDAAIPGGKQDQYMAAFGGVQDLRFADPDVQRTPIALDQAFAVELQRALVICYTGESRLSGATIARVMGAYDSGDAAVSGALARIRDAADLMADALSAADLSAVAVAMNENWAAQRQLDAGIQTARMAELEVAARTEGALALKAAGAGAGGCLVALAPGDAERVRTALEARDGQILPAMLYPEGVRTW